MVPFFSIVTSVYNGQDFIERAVKSVMEQDCQDYEYIIVNNGSTDNTANILDNLTKIYAGRNIKIITLEKNKGISGGRNTGIFAAEGKYICFLDADDYWYSNKLSEVKKVFEDSPEIDVVCHWENHIKGEQTTVGEYRTLSLDNPYEDLLFNGNSLSTSAMAINSGLLKSIKGFDLTLVSGEEDYDCWMRLASKGARFFTLNKPLGVWIIREDSISNKHLKHLEAVLNVVNKHFTSYTSSHYDADTVEAFRKKANARLLCGYGRMLSKSHQIEAGNALYKRALKLNPINIKAVAGLLLNIVKL